MSETTRGKADAATDQTEPLPGLDEMIDSGDVDEPVPHGQFLELSALVHGLKARRERGGSVSRTSPSDPASRGP